MAHENPLWGAPRIHGELLKLGVQISQATVAKYMGRRATPPSQSWRTFLANHVQQIAAADFFVVPTATYRLLFVLVILAHERRRVVHVAVTRHPTAAWTAQQLREAFPWNQTPRYLIHDRDFTFQAVMGTTKAMGIEGCAHRAAFTVAEGRGLILHLAGCVRERRGIRLDMHLCGQTWWGVYPVGFRTNILPCR
jgi:putative transposase